MKDYKQVKIEKYYNPNSPKSFHVNDENTAAEIACVVAFLIRIYGEVSIYHNKETNTFSIKI